MDSINNGGYYPDNPNNKEAIIKKIQEEAALANLHKLVQKLNLHCFEKCVPTPGTSFSKKEDTCLSQCMDKYMATWNTVSRQYIERIQRVQAPRPTVLLAEGSVNASERLLE